MKKWTTVIILVFLMVASAAFPVYAAVKSPDVAVSYNQTADGVDVTLTWDDYGYGTTYHVDWADSMLSDGSGLNYQNIDGSIVTSSGKKSVTKTRLTAYRNYYFRVTNDDGSMRASSNVRVFPVNTGSGRKTNENAHGNYTKDTAMCGYCHNNHASLKSQLVQQVTYYQMCKLCHGTASTQSKYDVEAGMVTVAGGKVPSLAGPFVNGMTSRHDADDSAKANESLGTSDWGPVIVPGSDPSRPLSMTCLSCHDVHAGNDDNYRLLRKTIYADDARTDTLKTVNIDFEAYAITPSDKPEVGEQLYMVKGNTEFCSSCHMNYDDGNGRIPGKDPRLSVSEAAYRHPTSVVGRVYSVYGPDGSMSLAPSAWGPLPLQYNSLETKTGLVDKRTLVVCSTCHYAHGTTKKFDANSEVNKYILRLDNYGTCESCHKK